MRSAAPARRRTVQAAPYTSTAYDALVLADAPVAYWAPDGAQARDLSGNARHATIRGALTPTAMPGGSNTAAVFDGATSYLEVPDADAFSIPTTGALTIEAWVRPDVLEFPNQEGTGYVHWLGKGETNQQEWTARMYSLTNSETRPNRISGYAFNASGGLGTGSYFQDPVAAGAWIHYALVINTATSAAYPHGYTKVYKGGVQRDQDDLFSTAAVIPTNQTAPLRIGTRDLASFFKGAIGKVAVYNYELSQTRLLAHVRSLVPPVAGSGAFVRTIGAVAPTAAGTTMVIPVTAPVAAGSTIIVRAAHDYTTGGPTCVDSKGNTYTRDRTAANTGTTMRASIWSAPVTTALAVGDTITVTTTSVTARVAVASQFSGFLTPTVIDVQNGGAGTSTTPQINGGQTTTNPNDVLVVMLAVEGPTTDTFTEDTVDGLYSQTARIGTDTGGAADTNITLNCANRSVGTVANYNYKPVLGTSRNWIDFLIAYKAT